jgi:hypothetical protein
MACLAHVVPSYGLLHEPVSSCVSCWAKLIHAGPEQTRVRACRTARLYNCICQQTNIGIVEFHCYMTHILGMDYTNRALP